MREAFKIWENVQKQPRRLQPNVNLVPSFVFGHVYLFIQIQWLLDIF